MGFLFLECYKMFRFFFLICFSFLINVEYCFSQDIDLFFVKLKEAKNETIAKEYEGKIWNYWLNDTLSKRNKKLMQKGIKLMEQGKLDNALDLFQSLNKTEPNWPEPLNKIATIKYLQGDLYGSLRDIGLTLKLEPRHFGAISGLAQINFALGRYNEALKNINFVSEIHPYIDILKLKLIILNLLKKQEI